MTEAQAETRKRAFALLMAGGWRLPMAAMLAQPAYPAWVAVHPSGRVWALTVAARLLMGVGDE